MNETDKVLSPDLLRKMNAYWLAANAGRFFGFLFVLAGVPLPVLSV